MRKMVDQPKTTQKELANDLKAPGTTVTMYTIGNKETLQCLHVCLLKKAHVQIRLKLASEYLNDSVKTWKKVF